MVPGPNAIPPYTLIKALFILPHHAEGKWKYAVVLWHDDNTLWCMLGTSKITFYTEVPARELGCVRYGPDDCPHLGAVTRFEPHEIRGIGYAEFTKCQGLILGPVPDDFHVQAILAIARNSLVSDEMKIAHLGRLTRGDRAPGP